MQGERSKKNSLFGQNSLTFDTLGYINDDSNDVGKVHFGIVMYLDVSDVPTEDILMDIER